ncbi:hypothetical protein R1CP_40105 (plasmid) [Rhodococcus opacus]|uniref:Uncharacterized protein n=1 Tax=Rhodococcus opacus TaxID=37919 RepID=A0A1B1KJ19_RHOOP|nr:hypothetical protein [Rhodococcus opacus]ANS32602.1 hypothetical protein R1CP_40105 [Rhodococcus opacus]
MLKQLYAAQKMTVATWSKPMMSIGSPRYSILISTHTSGITDRIEFYTSKLRQRCYVHHSIEHPIDRIVAVNGDALVLGEMNARITVGDIE